MGKSITAILIALLIFFKYTPSDVKAALIFSDSFQGGYNQALWNLASDSSSPIATLFGIGGDNINSTYSLWSKTPPPLDAIVKVDLKINSIPSHTLLGCKGIDVGNENRVIFYGVNGISSDLIGTWKLASFVNGSGTGGNSGNWDITAGIHHLELDCIGNIMTVKEDGNTLGSWDVTGHNNFTATTVRFQYWFGNSEYANYQLCDGNDCDGLPQTPTPSPTLIPTPTPTPLPTTKVVVIPGLGASWNGDALLNCKSDGYEGDWIENPIATMFYQPLRDALSQNSWLPLSYYYDWRKEIPSHSTSLAEFITHNTIPNENVHLVGHSMGGLVGRAYLEDQETSSKLDHFLTAGSPHQGVPQPYAAWAGGEVWDESLLFRIAMTTLIKRCNVAYGTSDKESVQQVIPSVENLLPMFNYLRDMRTSQIKSVGSLNNQNNWLPTNDFASPFFGVTVGSLAGTGKNTLSEIEVKDANLKQFREGMWSDGAPTKKVTSTNGDGTVLESSSFINGAINTTIAQSHMGLVSSSLGTNAILSFLGLPQQSNAQVFEEPTSALVVMSYPAMFWVTDPDGKIFRDTNGLVGIVTPRKGSYKLFLQPKKGNVDIVVAQFLTDGRTLWKEYKHNSILPKFGSINFDPGNPLEDILR